MFCAKITSIGVTLSGGRDVEPKCRRRRERDAEGVERGGVIRTLRHVEAVGGVRTGLQRIDMPCCSSGSSRKLNAASLRFGDVAAFVDDRGTPQFCRSLQRPYSETGQSDLKPLKPQTPECI